MLSLFHVIEDTECCYLALLSSAMEVLLVDKPGGKLRQDETCGDNQRPRNQEQARIKRMRDRLQPPDQRRANEACEIARRIDQGNAGRRTGAAEEGSGQGPEHG